MHELTAHGASMGNKASKVTDKPGGTPPGSTPRGPVTMLYQVFVGIPVDHEEKGPF